MKDVLRKQIDLPKETIKDLKIVAAYSDKSVKKYMEDLIINDVKDRIKKIKK
jgi:hypothetical protein